MKAVIILIATLFGFWGLTLVVPDDIKDKALAAIGLNNFSVKEEVTEKAKDLKDDAFEAIIPKSPQEKRAELIERVEQTLADITAAQEAGKDTLVVAVDKESGDIISSSPSNEPEEKTIIKEVKVVEIVKEVEKIVQVLKEENDKSKDGPVGTLVSSVSEGISGLFGNDIPEACEVPSDHN